MEYFGIIKFKRVRKVYSKAKGTDVNVYDYVVETINSSSGQCYAFSANEDKNKVLASQGMTNGALGTVYFYTRVQTYTGKDGQEMDYNNVSHPGSNCMPKTCQRGTPLLNRKQRMPSRILTPMGNCRFKPIKVPKFER